MLGYLDRYWQYRSEARNALRVVRDAYMALLTPVF